MKIRGSLFCWMRLEAVRNSSGHMQVKCKCHQGQVEISSPDPHNLQQQPSSEMGVYFKRHFQIAPQNVWRGGTGNYITNAFEK